MVDLRAKPFELNEAQLQWVEDTIRSMTPDEKVGQLFINLTLRRDPAYLTELCEKRGRPRRDRGRLRHGAVLQRSR